MTNNFLPSAQAVPADAVEWSKSYNLGWKWCTGAGRSKRKKSPSSKIKQLHSLDGFGVLILPTPDLQETAYYLVVDRFSHSVAFSRLTVFTIRTADHEVVQCVRWVHDGSSYADSIESSLLFLKYFHACKQGKVVKVRSAFLSRDLSQQLFVSPGYLNTQHLTDQSVFCST